MLISFLTGRMILIINENLCQEKHEDLCLRELQVGEDGWKEEWEKCLSG